MGATHYGAKGNGMTEARERDLLAMVRTIREPDEMAGFVSGLKDNGEYTATIMQACRDHAKGRGWE